ncbi:MraY family glycosyltransferase [Salinisphaera sp. T5B8]|uniref:MraY family glycosyltransferase n=1 Tax=Salinisphaera sp. T5B8 TaxID=1304154 RepID=UPI0033416666
MILNLMLGLVAFVLSAFAILVLQPLCHKIGHVDHPGGRKAHVLATPLCGGMAIALTVVLLGMGTVPSRQFAGFAFGITVLLVLGALDDRKHVPAPVRLALQTLAVGAGMCFFGEVYLQNLGAIFSSVDYELGGHAIWFTIFAAVGMINAVNMVDGMDGLAGGFAVMIVGTILALAVGTSAVSVVLLCVTLGSVLGFLAFNLRMPWQKHARIFLGDAGSLVLGFILTWFAIQAAQGPHAVIEPITAVWLFGLPLADTVYLMVSRVLRGKSPLAADSYHFHHLLQRLGLSPGWALYVWLAFAGMFMATGLVTEALGVSESARCVGFVGVFAVYCVVANLLWTRVRHRLVKQAAA